jgi:lipid-binding SYLF domain-containing protein
LKGKNADIMKQTPIPRLLSLGTALALLQCGCVSTDPGVMPGTSNPASLDGAATTALQNLYASNPTAKALGRKARGILVFPDVLKGGLMWGAETGNGVLRQNGQTTGYYNITAASYGFQAGLESFGYALFLMNDSAMAYLHKTDGFELGVGPSIVVVDQGMARSITTSTLNADIYAFVFNQSGLMAGAGLQGSKITRIQQ